MRTADFDYYLPEELIAQEPVTPRDHSRLLVIDRNTGDLQHRHFYDIIEYLKPGDLLVMNDSRVIPARLLGSKVTGAAVEVVLIERVEPGLWKAIVKPGNKIKKGNKMIFQDLICTVEEHCEDSTRLLRFYGDDPEDHMTNSLPDLKPPESDVRL